MKEIKALKTKEKELTDDLNRIKILTKAGDISFKDKIKVMKQYLRISLF